MQGAYKKLKSGVKSLFDEWLNDAGGGDGSSFTKFHYYGILSNGGAPGYSFGEVIITVLTLAHLLVRQSTLRIADS